MNGGSPPVTFSMFGHVTQAIGEPDRPIDEPDFSKVAMADLDAADTKYLLKGEGRKTKA